MYSVIIPTLGGGGGGVNMAGRVRAENNVAGAGENVYARAGLNNKGRI